MSNKVLSLPLDNPFEVPEDCIVDLSLTKFSDDFIQNISTAFIYLRNIEYSGKIDFSRFDEQQLFTVVKTYMLRDIKDFNIEELDNTIFSFLIPGSQQKSLFTLEQQMRFVNENNDICEELYRLLLSLPIFITSLDKSNTFDFDYSGIEVIEDMPMTYECMLQLLKYDLADVVMFLPDELKPFDVDVAIFSKIFKYENATLADKAIRSTYSSLYSVLVDGVADGLSSTVLSEQ